jgi:hypothetical protein
MTYSEYIETTHKEIREAIRAFDELPESTPAEIKKAIWKALVEGLNLVQNEMRNETFPHFPYSLCYCLGFGCDVCGVRSHKEEETQ